MTDIESQTRPAPDSGPGPDTADRRVIEAEVGHLSDLAPSAMKVVSVGEHRVALIRTSKGVFALDNACPHQGYGLVTGALGSDTVTCQWHNWKFDVETGRCLLGEEDVACHRVTVADDGTMTVSVTEPTPAEERARLWPSFRRGLAADYPGQISRDTLRLLDAGATPPEIMADALARTLPLTDYGLAHELAMAADCLAWTGTRQGDDRLLPLVQGLSGLAEETRDRRPHDRPAPEAVAAADDRPVDDLIEAEDALGSMASTLAQLERGAEPGRVRAQFIRAASAHHLSYGHGAIYTQKSFEMLDQIGWQHAPAVLPYLALSLTYGTREDTLPYMAKASRALQDLDLAELARAAGADRGTPPPPAGSHRHGLATALVESDEHPIALAAEAVAGDHGVEGLLDAVTEAVSLRLLDHDLTVETDTGDSFGWLDVTHGLTLSEAARWAWRQEPGPDTVRLALFAAWLAHDTGRHHRRTGRDHGFRTLADVAAVHGADGSGDGSGNGDGWTASALDDALLAGDERQAVALALTGGIEDVTGALARAALDDRSAAFIVLAHLIKSTEAASREARRLGSTLPLAAVARFVSAPRLERFVARNVAETIGFIRTGRPPRR